MYINLPSLLIQLTTMSENKNRPNRPRKRSSRKEHDFQDGARHENTTRRRTTRNQGEDEASSKATRAKALRYQRPNREKEKKLNGLMS